MILFFAITWGAVFILGDSAAKIDTGHNLWLQRASFEIICKLFSKKGSEKVSGVVVRNMIILKYLISGIIFIDQEPLQVVFEVSI